MESNLPDMIDDRALMRRASKNPCQHCAHARLDTSTRFHHFVCPGFPDGTPVAIQRGENDHTDAVEGNHGYRFKPLYPLAQTDGQWIQGRLPAPEMEPEPLCEPHEATPARLEECLRRWEASIDFITRGLDDEDMDEYQQDLLAREDLHAILNDFAALGLVLPEGVAARVTAADEAFRALTVAGECVWGSRDEFDPVVFWYYFR